MPDRLRAEIHQDDPFDSPEEEVFLNLQRTAAILTGRFAAELRAWGLTPAQYNVLRILRGAGPGGRTCGEVGERLVAPGPDVTRLIDRLERAGLVARERDEADRRVVRARIRRDGLARLAALDEELPRWLADLLGHLDRAELNDLSRLLEAARTNAPSGGDEPSEEA